MSATWERGKLYSDPNRKLTVNPRYIGDDYILKTHSSCPYEMERKEAETS
jgi:hypothetical protein